MPRRCKPVDIPSSPSSPLASPSLGCPCRPRICMAHLHGSRTLCVALWEVVCDIRSGTTESCCAGVRAIGVAPEVWAAAIHEESCRSPTGPKRYRANRMISSPGSPLRAVHSATWGGSPQPRPGFGRTAIPGLHSAHAAPSSMREAAATNGEGGRIISFEVGGAHGRQNQGRIATVTAAAGMPTRNAQKRI